MARGAALRDDNDPFTPVVPLPVPTDDQHQTPTLERKHEDRSIDKNCCPPKLSEE